MTEKRKATKPQPRRVPSDDCEVVVGGKSYYPHVGESIWIIGGQKLGEKKSRWAFNRLSFKMDEIRPEPKTESESDEAYAERERAANYAGIDLVDKHYDEMIAWFAERVVKWDWTDDFGQPMPALDRTSAPFMKLTDYELYYIKDVLLGEGPAEVLKDGETSETT